MDVVDLANNNADFILSKDLKQREQEGEGEEVKRTGLCLYCGSECESRAHLFCCPECKEDWEREQKIHHKQFA